jgi:hypothetical protein
MTEKGGVNLSFEEMLKLVANPQQNTSFKDFSAGFSDHFNIFLLNEFKECSNYATSPEFFEKAMIHYDERESIFNDRSKNPHEKVKLYKLFQRFKDQIVFDLGAGMVPGHTYKLLNHIGIKGYVGIEPFNYNDGKKNLESDIKYYKENRYFNNYSPAEFINSDIKSVLEKIPDNSASFIATGIDNIVIDSSDYFSECNSLIEKKLHIDGVFIFYESHFFYDQKFYEKNSKQIVNIAKFNGGDITTITKKN